mmetsp:Transcript_13610/g.27610  ORF Transcript_13610/g.27610 Transcript_13610/m.27610 type:complete len:316 (-) Transcript_13610:93-1040(-)
MFSAPCACIITFSKRRPMACVSFLYMVVWLAMPIFLRCFLGSKWAEAACAYLAMNSASVRQPGSCRMYEATSCASAMFLMMRYVSHMEAVAIASSCAYFPWMIDVMPAFWCLSTVVHTLETHGQVVSTVVTPFESSNCISSSEAPKAGRITTSPSPMVSNRLPFLALPSFSKNFTSISPSSSLTPGLWISSLVMCIVLSGNWSRAAHASSIDRSTPQQKPNSLASTNVSCRSPSPTTISRNELCFICSTSSPANISLILPETSLWIALSNGEPPRMYVSLLMICRRTLFFVGVASAALAVSCMRARDRVSALDFP